MTVLLAINFDSINVMVLLVVCFDNIDVTVLLAVTCSFYSINVTMLLTFSNIKELLYYWLLVSTALLAVSFYSIN